MAADTPALAPVTREEFEALKEAFANQQKENAALRDQLRKSGPVEAQKQEVPALPDDTFSVNGKKYKFTVRQFSVPGEGSPRRITAVDALSDEALLKQLVQCGSGVIREVK